jgi:hypothetical protein
MKKVCKYCNIEMEYKSHQQFGGHIINCKFNPKREEIIRKRSESKLIERITYQFNCAFCEKEYELILTSSEFKMNRYAKCCSKKCSNKRSISFIDHDKIKKSNCIECGLEIDLKLNASDKNCKCDSCGNYKTNENIRFKKTKKGLVKNKKIVNNKIICKICGQEECKNKICKTWISGRSKIFIKLGFDVNKLGSLDFHEEYVRIVELLKEEYENNSLVEIGEKYNINYQTIHTVFKALGVKSRSGRDSVLLAFKKGRFDLQDIIIYPYKSGYHISWEGYRYWYRSSYELDFCKKLDDLKIRYEVEKIRIQYFDTKSNCERTAVPDFYLVDTNEIVEIKSLWTYDEQNMKDKVLSYRKNGYGIKLILDGKETIL